MKRGPARYFRALNGCLTAFYACVVLVTVGRIAWVFVASDSVGIVADFTIEMGNGLFVLLLVTIAASGVLRWLETNCDR